jgi:hypothetical protein
MIAEIVKKKQVARIVIALGKKSIKWKEHTYHLFGPCTGLSGPSVLKRAGQMPCPFRPKSACRHVNIQLNPTVAREPKRRLHPTLCF